MRLKPLNNLDEHDTYNFFALNTATGSKGTPVVIVGSGWNNSDAPMNISATQLVGNPSNLPNVFTPRWEIKARVRAAVQGEIPFGIQLYDVLENNQYNYPFLYDEQRRIERQVVLSGQAVPITKKGLLLVGPWPSGIPADPAPGLFVTVSGTGQWQVSASLSGVRPSGAFGEFIGSKDNDGYAPVVINCYKY